MPALAEIVDESKESKADEGSKEAPLSKGISGLWDDVVIVRPGFDDSAIGAQRINFDKESKASKEDSSKESKQNDIIDDKSAQSKEQVVDDKSVTDTSKATVEDKASAETVAAMSPNARDAFKKQEEKAKQAHARAVELEAKLKEFETKGTVVPDDIKTKLATLEQQNNELRANLRAASIERDPEFVAKYNDGKKARVSQLRSLAVASGTSGEDFDAVWSAGDEDRLADFRETLTPANRVKWDAHQQSIANLDFERQEAVKNSDKTWADLQKRQEAQWEQHSTEMRNQNLKIASDAVDKSFEFAPMFKDDEAYVKELRDVAQDAAINWTPDQIIGSVVMTRHQNKVIQIQSAVIKGHEEKLTALEAEKTALAKKVEELESFVSSRANGSPRSDSFSSAPDPGNGKPRSWADEVVINAPGVRR